MKKDYIVSRTDLHLYVKMTKKAMKRRRKKKIVIKISTWDSIKDRKRVIARLKIRPKASKWHRISLPLSVLNKLQKQNKRTLEICIECKRCNRRIKVTFLKKERRKKKLRNKKTKKSKKHNRRRLLKLNKNRPFLLCKITTKSQSFRSKRYALNGKINVSENTNMCNENLTSQGCCVSNRYVSFREMNLHRYITYPRGFNFSQCLGSCSQPSGLTLATHNQTDSNCQPVNYGPLYIFVIFKREIGFITIRKGNVHSCGCS